MPSFFLKNFLDVLFPRCCAGCGCEGCFVCEECLGKVKLLREPSGYVPQNFECLYVCVDYQESRLVRDILHSFKYRFVIELCDCLGWLMQRQFDRFFTVVDYSGFVIVPVPSHPKRVKYRGFSQTRLLAESFRENLGERSELVELWDCLERLNFYKEQMKLDRDERMTNVKGAIKLKEEFAPYLEGKTVLLIDDVATTCSTLEECALALRGSGVAEIFALVLARA